MAERLRQGINQHSYFIDNQTRLTITCSIGFCVLPLYTDSPEHLDWEGYFSLLDECLYAAKRSGRDCWIGLTGGRSTSHSASATSLLEEK